MARECWFGTWANRPMGFVRRREDSAPSAPQSPYRVLKVLRLLLRGPLALARCEPRQQGRSRAEPCRSGERAEWLRCCSVRERARRPLARKPTSRPRIVCVVVRRVLRVLASEDAASHLQLSPAGHALDHSDRLVSDHLDSFYEGIMRVLLVPIPL